MACAQRRAMLALLLFAITSSRLHVAVGQVNNWDGSLYYQCSAGCGLSYVSSYHSNNREDRRWSFSCASVGTGYSSSTTSSGFYDYAEYDRPIDMSCATDYYLERLQSVHSNSKEDRVWVYGCRRGRDVKLLNCGITGYLNDFDAYLSYTVSSNRIITGLASYHSNHNEDRRWRVRYCDVECDLGNNYVNRAGTRQCDSLPTTSISNNVYVNNFRQPFSVQCPDNMALISLNSYHDNTQEDRRWYFACQVPRTRGAQLSRQSWSAPTYGQLSSTVSFTCPSNSFLTGMRSAYVVGNLDRVMSFQCSSSADTRVSTSCYTSSSNSYDGALRFASSNIYVVTGLTSYFSSWSRDRVFRFTACRLDCAPGTQAVDGVCRAIVCPPLTLASGSATGTCNGAMGGLCSFSCYTGYRLEGSTSRTCQSNGVWTGSTTSCERITCGSLTHSQITMTGSCGGDFGDRCTYSYCPSGYAMRGSTTTRECTANGWTGSAPYCEKLECPAITSISGGYLSGECTGNLNDRCVFQCNEGAVLSPRSEVGVGVRECKQSTDSQGYVSAAWTGSAYSCQPIKCGQLSLANGLRSGSCGGNFGDVCALEECNRGYRFATGGATTCNCGEIGGVSQWKQGPSTACPARTCEVVTCNAVHFTNGQGSGLCDGTVGGQCTLQCNTGYWPSSEGSTSATCVLDSSGHSAAWNAKFATCKEVRCPALSLNQGSTSGSCSGRVGDQCRYSSCNDGFRFGAGGTSVRTCQQNGANAYWSGAEKTCVEVIERSGASDFKVTCAPGQAFTAMYYTAASNEYAYVCEDVGDDHDQRIFTVPEEQFISGTYSRYCDFNTYATSAVSKAGASFEYECSLLIGVTLTNCRLGGTLSGSYSVVAPEGSVIAGMYNSRSATPRARVCDVQCREHDGYYASGSKTCRRLSCGELTLENGSISGKCKGRKDDTCTYKGCDNGYELSSTGTGTRTCTIQDGRAEWSGTPKTCERIVTTSEPTTTNPCTGLRRAKDASACRTRCNQNNQDSTFFRYYEGCTHVCTCGCRKQYAIKGDQEQCTAHCASLGGLQGTHYPKHGGCRNVCLCTESGTRSVAAATTGSQVAVTGTSNTIKTVAGNGKTAWTGSSQPTQTGLNQAECVAVDGSGNMYVALRTGHRVVRIARGDGAITTVAGTGTAGDSGVGGAAASAQLNRPTCVALDAAGNVYISEEGSHRVSVVDATSGDLSVLVGTGHSGHRGMGGSSRAADIHTPRGLAVDNDAKVLYVADAENHVVYSVDLRTLSINVYAGTPNQRGYRGDNGPAVLGFLNGPTALALSASSNRLYIADTDNNRIRLVDLDSGVIDTIAGSGLSGASDVVGSSSVPALEAKLNRPEGVAVSEDGDQLVIADTTAHVLRLVQLSSDGAPVSVVAGTGKSGYVADNNSRTAADAPMDTPVSVAYDVGEQAVVFVDQQNRRVRRLYF
ncbi:hypothetical protein PTSG_12546 [Salpingoeca rosetta]|uniref:Sushi domain-containing protein n=1 Tax=Salpingoeca rosetta (strain ATCC 50818 / BSB-021) TaxID=946362 RepID=F2UEB6_SALR5|nr:uncharacterized protein PTSG_12546 [Salpingoeca rosetta]EGD74966.1 hypothetical protein PTSG_12546 [Salpingoeca rosetta]|eukprot:XP_004992611.1 hypothetical protein PTSG_12546 [Salpingoeca rosetta]